jgi:hypothetical protein
MYDSAEIRDKKNLSLNIKGKYCFDKFIFDESFGFEEGQYKVLYEKDLRY